MKANVLVVEDDPGVSQSLRFILKEDYNVLLAESAGRALEILASERVDAVTLEPRLRGIQGRELLELLRQRIPDVPIILVTGHRLSRWFDATIRDEVFDYIPKPPDTDEVLTAVRKSQRVRELSRAPVCM